MKSIFFSILIFTSSAQGFSESSQKIILLSQPKAGTHLLKKLLFMLTGSSHSKMFAAYSPTHKPKEVESLLSEGGLPIFHIFSPHCTKRYFKTHHGDAKLVLIIRDPRDALVSYGFWSTRGQHIPIEERIDKALKNTAYQLMTQNIHIFLDDPRFHVIRFEDLVGEEGGGSFELQRATIARLAQYLSLELSSDEIDFFAKNLWGNKPGYPSLGTFRKGKIGSWKTHLTEKQKQYIDTLYADELRLLGYE